MTVDDLKVRYELEKKIGHFEMIGESFQISLMTMSTVYNFTLGDVEENPDGEVVQKTLFEKKEAYQNDLIHGKTPVHFNDLVEAARLDTITYDFLNANERKDMAAEERRALLMEAFYAEIQWAIDSVAAMHLIAEMTQDDKIRPFIDIDAKDELLENFGIDIKAAEQIPETVSKIITDYVASKKELAQAEALNAKAENVAGIEPQFNEAEYKAFILEPV